MAIHTVILGAWCTFSWITRGSVPHQKTRHCWTIPHFWAHSANAILWCLYLTLNLGNTVILYGYTFKSLLNICCTDRLDITSCAAAFLVDLLGLLCSAILTASVFARECTDKGWRCFLSSTEPSLLNWLESLWKVLNEGTHSVWKWARHSLCVNTTFLVSVKNNILFMSGSTDSLPCHQSCVNWRMSRYSATLARFRRIRTNLHDLLMCYHVTKHLSLHG
jgi:hypothetical protein